MKMSWVLIQPFVTGLRLAFKLPALGLKSKQSKWWSDRLMKIILTVDRVNRKVTHLVASTSRTRTHKVRQAAKYDHIKIVNQQWLLNSMSKWQKEDETPYLVNTT